LVPGTGAVYTHREAVGKLVVEEGNEGEEG